MAIEGPRSGFGVERADELRVANQGQAEDSAHSLAMLPLVRSPDDRLDKLTQLCKPGLLRAEHLGAMCLVRPAHAQRGVVRVHGEFARCQIGRNKAKERPTAIFSLNELRPPVEGHSRGCVADDAKNVLFEGLPRPFRLPRHTRKRKPTSGKQRFLAAPQSMLRETLAAVAIPAFAWKQRRCFCLVAPS